MAERVAVVFAQRTFGRSAYVGEDQVGSSLGGEPLQIHAVPGGGCRCEQAGGLAEFRVCVEANTEAIGIVLATPSVL